MWLLAVDHPAGKGWTAGDPETRGDGFTEGHGNLGSRVFSPSLILRWVKTKKFLRSSLFLSIYLKIEKMNCPVALSR